MMKTKKTKNSRLHYKQSNSEQTGERKDEHRSAHPFAHPKISKCLESLGFRERSEAVAKADISLPTSYGLDREMSALATSSRRLIRRNGGVSGSLIVTVIVLFFSLINILNSKYVVQARSKVVHKGVGEFIQGSVVVKSIDKRVHRF